MKQRIFEALKRYLIDNILILAVLTISLIVGIIFGAIATSYMDEAQKNETITYVNGFLGEQDSNVSQVVLFKNIFANDAKFILIYWFLGVTVIGIPFIIFLVGFNGFCIGFSVGFILKYFVEVKAVLMVIYSVLPQGLVLLPCIILLSISGIKFSMQLLRGESSQANQVKLGLVKHVVLAVFLLGVVAISAFLESLLLKTIF